MSVFLRWGVFGILGVAALLYAYNASKRMAEAHARKPQPQAGEIETPASAPAAETEAGIAPLPEPASETAIPRACEAELQVARRAVEMKLQGAPLDRVLRMQEIAWQELPERRERLAAVAVRWFGYEADFSPSAMRVAVVNDCQQHLPAP